VNCPRPYCKGSILDGECHLCGRSVVSESSPPIAISDREGRATVAVRRSVRAQRAQVLVYLTKHPGSTTVELAKALGMDRKTVENRLNTMYTAHLIDKPWKASRGFPNQWFVAGEREEEATA
jgi:hypothetical protein